MINSIIGTNGVHVFNGYSNTYVNGDLSQLGPGVPGELRMVGNSTYVWNGYWTIANNPATTIELTPEIQGVIFWAQQKMRDEARLKEQLKNIEKYPSVQAALDNLKSAQDQLELVSALVHEHE